MHNPNHFFRNAGVATICAMALLALPAGATLAQKLTTDAQKTSYSMGYRVGQNMQRSGIEIESDSFAKGVADAIAGGNTLLTQEEMQQVLAEFQEKMRAKQQQAHASAGTKNKTDGEKFLAANKSKKGVKTHASGVQYKVLQSGKGKTPGHQDTVLAHYRGTLLDGTEFDSSIARGKPAEFPVGGVIKGWQTVLQMMKEGDKWQVWIPADQAYGERGAGPKIGPNATLSFEIELIKVNPGK